MHDRIRETLRQASYGSSEMLDAVEACLDDEPELLVELDKRLKEDQDERDEMFAPRRSILVLGRGTAKNPVTRGQEDFEQKSRQRWEGPRRVDLPKKSEAA